MWLGLAFVTVVGVGVPVLAWWLTGRMARGKRPYSGRRVDAFGALLDPIDRWLADHTEVPALQRWRVRQAVLGGRAAQDESLRPVARELASELLAGQVKSDLRGWGGRALALAGGSELVFALVVYLVTGHVEPWLVSPALYGVLALTVGLARPRLLRHRVDRAMRLNT